MGWSATLLLVTAASAHSYSSSAIGYSTANDLTACAPDAGCIKNRLCSFGTEENYKIARAALFEATGRAKTCYDKCECSPNPTNQVATILISAQNDQYIYGNNTVCNSHVLQAAMYYPTAGFTCEEVFAEAQGDLIRLCGVQNGRSCLGKCVDYYQIDKPKPLCEQHVGIQEQSLFIVLAYFLFCCTVASWTSGIEIYNTREPSTRLRKRFTSTRYASHQRDATDSYELDSLLGSFF